ncbi:MAG: hypothetical protein Q7T74_00950 [Candidatus Saccharibacteria bacterium]|nr:hypothetical protein [Candidatus Saccharibacteria bacterium]
MAVQEVAHKFNIFEKIEMLAPEVQNVLNGARVEAGDKRYETTHSVHVLTALLECDELEIAESLRNEGLAVEDVQGAPYALLKKKPQWDCPQQWRPRFSVQVEQAIRLVDENDSAEGQMRSLLRAMIDGEKGTSVLLNQTVFTHLGIEAALFDETFEAQAA